MKRSRTECSFECGIVILVYSLTLTRNNPVLEDSKDTPVRMVALAWNGQVGLKYQSVLI